MYLRYPHASCPSLASKDDCRNGRHVVPCRKEGSDAYVYGKPVIPGWEEQEDLHNEAQWQMRHMP